MAGIFGAQPFTEYSNSLRLRHKLNAHHRLPLHWAYSRLRPRALDSLLGLRLASMRTRRIQTSQQSRVSRNEVARGGGVFREVVFLDARLGLNHSRVLLCRLRNSENPSSPSTKRNSSSHTSSTVMEPPGCMLQHSGRLAISGSSNIKRPSSMVTGNA